MHRERKGQLAISEKSCHHISTLTGNARLLYTISSTLTSITWSFVQYWT